MKRWTTARIRASKGTEQLVCLTAYDTITARLIDAAGLPLALVGDSLGMTVLGYEDTLPVTLDQMLHHASAVRRGARNALVVGDMPFMSYQVSIEQGLLNAGRFLKEAGADAVKIEGGAVRAELIAALTGNGIPVLAHIGLLPQSIRETGGYKVLGRDTTGARRLIEDAHALVQAGAFAIVLECLPVELAREITEAVPIPTIGIGAGPHCDGQILVISDMLGLQPDGLQPRFVKRYAELATTITQAISNYKDDILNGRFPAAEHGYS